MTSINYKQFAEKVVDLLVEEYSETFADLYERGGVGDSDKDYEIQQAEWIDAQIVKYLPITPKQLDQFYHGEVESDIEWVLRTACEKLNDNLDESSFEDDQSYQRAIGRLDGLSDALGAVMMLEHDNSTTKNPKEVLAQCFDVEI